MFDTQIIKAAATEAGFDACGVAAALPITEEEFGLNRWLANGCQAGMRYMEGHTDMRHDAGLLVPGAKSVIAVLLGYKPSRRIARIAQYAYGEDYHERMKRMLYEMIALIRKQYPKFEAKPCVDTVPISDKLWARRAGLGWIGKNTLLVNPALGSYCFIGELVTTEAADRYDTPMAEGCDDCERCLRGCPNKAIGNGVDARRCASYHTIENRDERLPEGIRLSGYAFGCDCCQMACPYNEQAAVRYELAAERELELESLATADAATFKRLTKHSAINRIKQSQWLRNMAANDEQQKAADN